MNHPQGSNINQRTSGSAAVRGPNNASAAARPAARDVASNFLSACQTEGSQLNNPTGNDLEGGSLSGSGKDGTTVETQLNSQPDSQPDSDDKGSGTQNHENDGDEEENRGDLDTGTPSEARDSTKRHLWTSADDAALSDAMRSTGMGAFYVKGKYLPVGEVDWELVTDTFNQNTRSSKFSKKQVKDRWEQHKRPGLLKHKSLPKAARQQIIAFLHKHVGTSQYEARGRRLIRWIDLTMDLWEIGITCSTSTTKNVWNSHQSKIVRDAPMTHSSRQFDNQSPMVNQFDHQPSMSSGSKRPSSAMDEQTNFLMREDRMRRPYPGHPYFEGSAMPNVHHAVGNYPRPHHGDLPRLFPPGHHEGLPAAEGQPLRWNERHKNMHAQPQHAPGGMGQYKPHGPRYGEAPFPGRPYFSPSEQRDYPGRPYPEINAERHYRSYGNFPDAAGARELPSHHAQQGGAWSSRQGSALHHGPPSTSRHPGQHSGRFSYGLASVPGPAEPRSAPGQQQQQGAFQPFQHPGASQLAGSDAAHAKQSSNDNYNPWWRGYML